MANVFRVVLCFCLCINIVLCQFGFYPPQNNGNQNGRQFGFGQNLFPIGRRVLERVANILHFGSETSNGNNDFILTTERTPVHNENTNFNSPQYPVQNEVTYVPNTFKPTQEYEIVNGNQFTYERPNEGFIFNPERSSTEYTQNQQEQEGREIPTFINKPDLTANDNTEAAGFTSEYPLKPLQPQLPSGGIAFEERFSEEASTESPSPILSETTKLPELTPVPISEPRNNFNFGTQGLFHETCQTIEGDDGTCLSIYECQPFLSVVKKYGSSPTVAQMLRKAHCGFEGTSPKVCCPRPGIPTAPPPSPEPITTTTTTTTSTTTTTTTTQAPFTKSVDVQDFVAAFPQPPECGISNASFSRVVGGYNAKLGDFPWMALLGYKSRRHSGIRWLCGGTLITSHHTLTAAHCIHGHESDLYVVRLGELDLARDDDGAFPVDSLIKKLIKHEEYNSNTYTNDIGIIVLETRVAFSDLIRPICMPQTQELRSMNFVDYNPLIAGWGDTEFRGLPATHLQALQLPVVSNEFCAKAYQNYKAQQIDSRVLCAGYEKGGKDACQGDSGGPLMQPIWNSVELTTYFYQIGVVSFGRKCAEIGFPGVYTRVTSFIPWLENKVLGYSQS